LCRRVTHRLLDRRNNQATLDQRTTLTKHSTWRARPLRTLAAALGIVAISLLAVMPSASAAPHRGTRYCALTISTSNACLRLDYMDFGWWDAHSHVDVYMPEQYAREIVACGARFRAELWTDDGGGSDDDRIRDHMPIDPGSPVATPDGLRAAFTLPTLKAELDEDPGTATDEIYARISFYDCHTGLTRSFRTGTVKGDYRY
jgi:hypothetical protein